MNCFGVCLVFFAFMVVSLLFAVPICLIGFPLRLLEFDVIFWVSIVCLIALN